MTRLAFALLLVALASGSAAAQTLPEFNREQSCKALINEQCRTTRKCDHYEVAAYTSGCVLQEAIAIDKIRGKWHHLSPSIRSYCLRWLGPVENYHVLNECLDREFAAREPADGWRFTLQLAGRPLKAFPTFKECQDEQRSRGVGVCVGGVGRVPD